MAIAAGTFDANLLFGANCTDRGVCVYAGDRTTPLTSRQMHDSHCQPSGINEMSTLAYHLEKLKKKIEGRVKEGSNQVALSNVEQTLLDPMSAIDVFINVIRNIPWNYHQRQRLKET